MDQFNSTKSQAAASWRVFMLVAASSVFAFAAVSLVPWQTTLLFDTAIAAAASTAAMAAAALALARHFSADDRATLLIGLGLLGAGLLHAVYALVAVSGFDSRGSLDAVTFMDWTGFASRFWLSLFLYGSWLVTRHTEALGRVSSGTIGACAIAVITLVAIGLVLMPLPRIDTPGFLVTRPLEMLPATFFALTLFGYLHKGEWQRDRFERLLSVGVLLACFGEVSLIFLSRSPTDAFFGLAQLIQLSVYGLLVAALVSTATRAFAEVQSLDEKRRRDAIELANAREGLEAFMRSASHDLKAPLRHIFAFSKLIRDEAADRLTEREVADLERVMGAASHMSNLLESLLRFTRLGAPSRIREEVSLNELLETVVALLPVEDQSRVVVDAPLLDIRGDQALLTIVLQNLIENGLKYVDDDRSIVTVTSTSSSSGTTVSVDDNGIGVASKHSKRIFDPGVRAVSDSDFEGTGFGLATCARIIQAHDGRIWLESKPEGGSIFRFTIPG